MEQPTEAGVPWFQTRKETVAEVSVRSLRTTFPTNLQKAIIESCTCVCILEPVCQQIKVIGTLHHALSDTPNAIGCEARDRSRKPKHGALTVHLYCSIACQSCVLIDIEPAPYAR